MIRLAAENSNATSFKTRRNIMAHCSVPHCHNNWRHYRDIHESMNKKKLSFHVFPKKADLRERWASSIKKEFKELGSNFKISNRTCICSAHFLNTDFKFTLSHRRVLKEEVVPTIFNRNEKRKGKKPSKRKQSVAETSDLDETYNDSVSCTTELVHTAKFHDYHVSPQTTEEKLEAAQKRIEELEDILENSKLEKFGLHRFSSNDVLIKVYTGFSSYKALIEFYNSISEHVNKVMNRKTLNSFNKKLPLIDQLFMFLHKVRLGSLDQDLADKFNVTPATVFRNTTSWVDLLYVVFKSQPLWPSKEQVKGCMPECFKRKYGDVRVILHCIELKIQSSSSSVLSSALYSEGTRTCKSLVGITPAGAVSFVSKLFSGTISNEHIIQISGILDRLEQGDKVMADGSFLIEKSPFKRKCKLVIPRFLSAEGQVSTLKKSEDNIRVYVEGAVSRLREYRIFHEALPLNLVSSINQIWTVSCLLTNVQQSKAL